MFKYLCESFSGRPEAKLNEGFFFGSQIRKLMKSNGTEMFIQEDEK